VSCPSRSDNVLRVIGACALAPLLIIVGLLLGGFLVQTLWDWFIAPVTGFRTISILESMGLTLVAYYFSTTRIPKDEKVGELLARAFGKYIVVWVTAIILHWLIVR
jgi:hypothetical protein